MDNIAGVIVDYIQADLRNRRDFRQLWDSLELEDVDEIINEWYNTIEQIIKDRLFDA